mmetsp:Transcript_115570/g.333872  ORF Transcript_115570/g.333872 Transcript_115570/m.333872 type:complete len:241 (-) Transcript_115570:698-1420(-)
MGAFLAAAGVPLPFFAAGAIVFSGGALAMAEGSGLNMAPRTPANIESSMSESFSSFSSRGAATDPSPPSVAGEARAGSDLSSAPAAGDLLGVATSLINFAGAATSAVSSFDRSSIASPVSAVGLEAAATAATAAVLTFKASSLLSDPSEHSISESLNTSLSLSAIGASKKPLRDPSKTKSISESNFEAASSLRRPRIPAWPCNPCATWTLPVTVGTPRAATAPAADAAGLAACLTGFKGF